MKRVLQDIVQRLIVQAGWQVGTQDRIKARPHWDGKEDDVLMCMCICVCSEVEPAGLSQREVQDWRIVIIQPGSITLPSFGYSTQTNPLTTYWSWWTMRVLIEQKKGTLEQDRAQERENKLLSRTKNTKLNIINVQDAEITWREKRSTI